MFLFFFAEGVKERSQSPYSSEFKSEHKDPF